MTRDPQVTEKPADSAEETSWMLASQWIARTLAVTLVMTAPGLAGAYLDRQLGTSIFALLGFGLGLLLGTTGLLVLARHLTPTARGPTPPADGDSARPSSSDADDGR